MNLGFKILKLFVVCGFVFVIFTQQVEAAVVIQAPKYIGLNSGLVGYWSFNGPDIAGIPSTATSPGTVYDRSGNGNNGQYWNATGTQPVAGKIGQAINFDGVDDYVFVNQGFGNADIPRTMAAWFYKSAEPIDPDSNQQIVVVNDESGGLANNSVQIQIAATSGIIQGVKAGGTVLVNSSFIPSLKVWYHVVLIYDGTTWRIFVDGVERNSASTAAQTGATTKFWIGTFNGAQQLFTGAIDEVRIYNRALSGDEIKRLYKIGSTLKVNTSINNDTLKNGLVGYWSFNGPDMAGVTVYDRSGQGNNGELIRGTSESDLARTAGKIGQALRFDGVAGDYITTADVPFDFERTDKFSASAWVKAAASSSEMSIVSKEDPLLVSRGWAFYANSSGGARVFLTSTWPSNALSKRSSVAINDDHWHHAAFTYDGNGASGLNIYIDGVLSNGTLPQNTLSGSILSGEPLLIGAIPGGGGALPMKGLIDDVRVYNRVLSADEIKRLYKIGATLKVNTSINNDSLKNGLVGYWSFDGKDIAGIPSTATSPGTVYDRSGQGNNGLYYNATGTSPVIGKIGQALNFDGTNDQIIVTNNSGLGITGNIAISAWVRRDQSNRYETILSKTNGSVWNYQFGFCSGSAGDGCTGQLDKLNFYSNAATPAFVNSTGTISDNNWHHVVASRSGSTMSFYIDGDSAGTASFSGSFNNNSFDIWIGNDGVSSPTAGTFDGLIDDVRVYNRALTPSEIQRLYNLGR